MQRNSKNSCGKLCELKLLNDSLIKENVSKDREIRQLNKDVHQYEQTILNLRKEISMTKFHTPDVSKRDAEVMAGMCWTGTECGDWEPVKDFTELLQVETQQFQDRIQKMETSLKSSSDSVRALRKVNVSLTEEMHAMRRVCAALVEESRAATVRAQFKDDIIKEMRRQLKQAKAKLKEITGETNINNKDFVSGDGECPRGSVSYDSVTIACVRAQPRRKRDVPIRDTHHRDTPSREIASRDNTSRNTDRDGLMAICDETESNDCPRGLNESGDELVNLLCCHGATSTPDISRKVDADTSPDVSIIERSTSPPILVSDASLEEGEERVNKSIIIKDFLPNDTSTSSPDQRLSDSHPGSNANHLGPRSPHICHGIHTIRPLSKPSSSKACSSSNSPKTSLQPHSPKRCQNETCPGLQNAMKNINKSLIKSSPTHLPKTCDCSIPETTAVSVNSQSPSTCQSSKTPVVRIDPCPPRICPGPDPVTYQSPRSPKPTTSQKPPSIWPSPFSPIIRKGPGTPLVCIDPTVPSTSSRLPPPSSCINIAKESPRLKCAQIQTPERKDESQSVQELFLNVETKKNDDSNSGDDECGQKVILKKTPSCEAGPSKKANVSRSCTVISKDSGGACSLVDSANGSCDANTRANYYHNKLRSTLQILQNKEETIRVQAESLSVAEGRISTLTERATELRRELERKSKELQALRKSLECCRVEKVDVSIEADPEMENQTDIVNTLQNNLSVIEELYRECFYETAKQEGLIDMLRKSYLDVRLMDKQKADQIGRMQTVINNQKWSLDRCQDIALEVDNLKMEISNFLSSSNTSTNNDSGMWERSEESFMSVPEVQEELQEVIEQLLRLREILILGCTCGLDEENMRLKRENLELEKRIVELGRHKCDLEQALEIKERLEKQHKEEIECRDGQLASMRHELIKLREEDGEKTVTNEHLSKQLRESQVLLNDKNEELSQMKEQCDSQRETIQQLQQDLKKADNLCKENCKIRSEVTFLNAQVAQWRSQLMESEEHVRKVVIKLRQTQACYREKESNVTELRLQLEQARARGAALCADARRALDHVRHWAKRMRERHREHENIIKEKDAYISELRHRLAAHSSSTVCTSTTDPEPCSKCSASVSRQPSCCAVVEERRSQQFNPSASEIASCSSAPTPPKRQFRKKPVCEERCTSPPWRCSARRDACLEPRLQFCSCPETTSRGVSPPIDELSSRMEEISKAFADSYRRWTRADPR